MPRPLRKLPGAGSIRGASPPPDERGRSCHSESPVPYSHLVEVQLFSPKYQVDPRCMTFSPEFPGSQGNSPFSCLTSTFPWGSPILPEGPFLNLELLLQLPLCRTQLCVVTKLGLPRRLCTPCRGSYGPWKHVFFNITMVVVLQSLETRRVQARFGHPGHVRRADVPILASHVVVAAQTVPSTFYTPAGQRRHLPRCYTTGGCRHTTCTCVTAVWGQLCVLPQPNNVADRAWLTPRSPQTAW